MAKTQQLGMGGKLSDCMKKGECLETSHRAGFDPVWVSWGYQGPDHGRPEAINGGGFDCYDPTQRTEYSAWSIWWKDMGGGSLKRSAPCTDERRGRDGGRQQGEAPGSGRSA